MASELSPCLSAWKRSSQGFLLAATEQWLPICCIALEIQELQWVLSEQLVEETPLHLYTPAEWSWSCQGKIGTYRTVITNHYEISSIVAYKLSSNTKKGEKIYLRKTSLQFQIWCLDSYEFTYYTTAIF